MDNTTAAVAAALTSLLVTITGFLITWLKDGRARKWIREDREQAARERQLDLDERRERLTKESEERVAVAKEVKEKLDAVHQDFKKDLEANTKVNEEALFAANGTNEKLLRMAESVAVVPHSAAALAVAAITAIKEQIPTKVEVVNTVSDPVHVTDDTKRIV